MTLVHGGATVRDLTDRAPTTAGGPPPTVEESDRRPLPAWPFTCLFALFPVWWALGVVDVVIVPVAAVMTVYLALRGRVRVPRWFGVWAVFLVCMLCSVVELTTGSQYLTFGYRASIYLAATVILVYVYNARRTLPDRRVLGHLTIYWVTVVVGGLVGMIWPTGTWHTPAFDLLERAAPGLLTNDLVVVMVVRPFAQYSPDGYFHVPPRPSAPFLFTNEWGNAYSLLLPLVLVVFFGARRRGRLRRALTLLLPLSAVPAVFTLNRGMMLGLGIALAYVSVRLALRHRYRAIGLCMLAMAVVPAVWYTLPLQEALTSRGAVSTTTRASLYGQSLHAAAASPVFGYGVPIASTGPMDPAVGTQGQVWMVLISHGIPALVCFLGFFIAVVISTMRRTDRLGLVGHTVMLVSVVELLYYGSVPYGLPVMMCVAALVLRAPPRGDARAHR